jgi:hypothetical protein
VLDPDGASVAVVLGRWSRARGTDRLGAVCVRTRSGRCLRVPVGLTTDAADVAWVGPNEVLITARDGAWLAVPGDTAPTTAWLSPRAEPWPGASPLVSIDREARVALVAAREEGRPRDGAALRALDFERRALSTPLAQGEPLRGVASWCGAEGAFAVLRPPKDGLGTALALGRRTPKGVTLERTLVLGGTMDREVLGVSSDQRWLVLQYHDWVSELIDLAVLRALPTVAQRVGPVQNQVP